MLILVLPWPKKLETVFSAKNNYFYYENYTMVYIFNIFLETCYRYSPLATMKKMCFYPNQVRSQKFELISFAYYGFVFLLKTRLSFTGDK